MDALAKVDLLAVWVAEALNSSGYGGQDSQRVREVPDVRTIRYYTTLGLLDKPSEMKGRTAYYGRKHLLQIVAIKRLQSQGLPLASIQQKLLGADEPTLKTLAGLTDNALQTILASQPSPEKAATTPTKFWERTPQWQPLAKVASEHPVRPAVLLQVCPGASLVLEGRAAERLEQLAPALKMIRDILKDTQGEPTNTETRGDNELPGEPPCPQKAQETTA